MAIRTSATSWKGEVALALQAVGVVGIVAHYHADVGRLRDDMGLKYSRRHWRGTCKSIWQVRSYDPFTCVNQGHLVTVQCTYAYSLACGSTHAKLHGKLVVHSVNCENMSTIAPYDTLHVR